MADRTEKQRLNAPGRFYNDISCIDCDLCREIAPTFFRRDDEEGQSYVWNQPVSPPELELAREALDSCPTNSIGCDG
ncbi:ferredoxin [Luteolibacter luteus]|uniref:Ferredoxin n=1 Tax=Luteolibacter luteus TaxID=2728835 RepID=A0A858RI38_9BACT|nr:ferredoxin [Luteolibacter luteus]QJE96385.1 ferredoxin [Luteolibacter luteus]